MLGNRVRSRLQSSPLGHAPARGFDLRGIVPSRRVPFHPIQENSGMSLSRKAFTRPLAGKRCFERHSAKWRQVLLTAGLVHPTGIPNVTKLHQKNKLLGSKPVLA